MLLTHSTSLKTYFEASLKIQHVLRTWIYQEYVLRQILENAKSAVPENKPKRTNNNAAPQYDVLISVLNPRPDLQNVEWDVRSATECNTVFVLYSRSRPTCVYSYFFLVYIQPFLDKINLISNYTIKSQWKYQVPLEFPSKQVIHTHLNIISNAMHINVCNFITCR